MHKIIYHGRLSSWDAAQPENTAINKYKDFTLQYDKKMVAKVVTDR